MRRCNQALLYLSELGKIRYGVSADQLMKYSKPDYLHLLGSEKEILNGFIDLYQKLPAAEKQFVKKEFILQEKNWWKKVLSKSTFFRKKKKISEYFIMQLINKKLIDID